MYEREKKRDREKKKEKKKFYVCVCFLFKQLYKVNQVNRVHNVMHLTPLYASVQCP